jgi:hypothetical protein
VSVFGEAEMTRAGSESTRGASDAPRTDFEGDLVLLRRLCFSPLAIRSTAPAISLICPSSA